LFFDYAKIYLRSGDGGSGAVSLLKEKYAPRGGPDGGDGGRGGHLIFLVNPGLSTLSDFRYKRNFKAESGTSGGGRKCHGRDGADLTIMVPPGTLVREVGTQRVLADLIEPGMKCIILRGGRGGRGNAHFATSTRQTPRFAEKGEPGRELWVELELKILADVGLVGFPNAGKSTLLSRISAARPKIADYPFTTLIPNLGVVDHKGYSFVAVDVPGLIEGAHQGAGLGDQFLRHIERTRLLVHLVDLSGVISGRDPYQDYLQINQELALFNPRLAVKPQLVAANKIDLAEAQTAWPDFRSHIGDHPVVALSAATGEGISELLDLIAGSLAALSLEEPILPAEAVLDHKDDTAVQVFREAGAFIVRGETLLKRLARFDLENEESLRSLQRLLRRWGVEKALIAAGIKEGDTVRIGEYEFTYQDEEI
jgi:GTP-binding protein